MKMIIGLVIALFASVLSQTEVPKFVCDGVNTTFVEDVTDCTRWIRCDGTDPIVGSCPTPYFFHPIRQVCTQENKVTCFTCHAGLANVPVANSCNRYRRCVRGVAKEAICEPGTQFDFNSKQCALESTAVCVTMMPSIETTAVATSTTVTPTIVTTTTVTPTTVTPTTEASICPTNIKAEQVLAFHNPANCSTGWVCTQGGAQRIECDPRLHFHTVKLMCVLLKDSNCPY